MTTFPDAHELKRLEAKHGEALTRAESFPAGSPERREAMLEAERINSEILDWHEVANPTPLA